MKNLKTAACLALGCWAWQGPVIRAAEKFGMPDLVQVDNTCLPTSTANVILWFGRHGYPKLIPPGATPEEREDHVVHLLMADTQARYDRGTEMERVTIGIEQYIRRAGYQGEVEYRGLEGDQAFTQDWLQQNDDPNKGFVLLLTYCQYHPENNSFSDAWSAGHAVTLVNAEREMLLIHDPAHADGETGRKIITPRALSGGTFQDSAGPLPVAGLLMLSGSLLEAPPNSDVMLTGAVCITLHVPGSASPSPGTGPHATLAGVGADGRAKAAAPHAQATWWSWLVDVWNGK